MIVPLAVVAVVKRPDNTTIVIAQRQAKNNGYQGFLKTPKNSLIHTQKSPESLAENIKSAQFVQFNLRNLWIMSSFCAVHFEKALLPPHSGFLKARGFGFGLPPVSFPFVVHVPVGEGQQARLYQLVGAQDALKSLPAVGQGFLPPARFGREV